MTKLPGGSTLRVLCYHRLEDPRRRRADLAPELVSATPARFERHLRLLTRFYHPVGAEEVLAGLETASLPRGAVLVTFDDGYRDFLDIAWPLLKQYRVPAVLFVPTTFVADAARVFWWDAVWQLLSDSDRAAEYGRFVAQLKSLQPRQRAAAVQQLAVQSATQPRVTNGVLSWSELRQLAQDGLSVAAHSQTHELLDQLDRASLRQEVVGCRDDLVRELGHCPQLFAYPNGNVSAPVVDQLRAAGFRAGFTTVHGWNHLRRADPFLLRREGGHVSLARLSIKLLAPVAAAVTRRHPLPLAATSSYIA